MQGQAGATGRGISYILPIVVITSSWRCGMRRMRNLRPLRLETLWIVPVLYGAVVTMLFVTHPPTVVGWALAVVALLAGGALGWQRGKLMEIHVDPETHALGQKASLAGMLFLVGLDRGALRRTDSRRRLSHGRQCAGQHARRAGARHVHRAADRDVPARKAAARRGADEPRLLTLTASRSAPAPPGTGRRRGRVGDLENRRVLVLVDGNDGL